MTWVATGTAALTAAEVAAAEAAMIAAAEAAAVAAAETAAANAAAAAAAEGASAAAIEAAAATAAETAATTTATNTAAAEAATATAETVPGSILEASAVPTPAQPVTPAGLEQVAPAGSTPPPPAEPVGIQTATLENLTVPDLDTQLAQMANDPAYSNVVADASNSAGPQTYADMPTHSEAFSAKDSLGPVDEPELLNRPDLVSKETNPFLEGAKDTLKWMDANPFKTGVLGYMGLQATGALNQKPQQVNPQKSTFKNPYYFSDKFQGSNPDPNVYKPSYSGYAAGGITQASAPTPGLMDGSQPANVNFMGKDMYPMSQQSGSYYATPTQMPTSAQQSMANYESNTNPLTGEISMAQGGIARYYIGDLATSTGGRGDVYGATQRFLDLYDPQSRYQAPAEKGDPGIFRDSNPSTRDKLAADVGRIRQDAIAKRTQVNTRAKPQKPSVRMGEINLRPQGAEREEDNSESVLAARGGIMQANLGSYAAGGNLRLLKGPGDGMSDNIPATIGGKQPARLADGEFVVPADVVSHLGNGSTDAGAKKLHGMMDKVRMDRTGKKKQAPAVKAKKYLPK